MGLWACTRLAPLGNQTPITPSNIYFLDNGFHPLATSQKVCDAWREQSGAKDKRLCAVRWLTHGSERVSASKNWPPNSNGTSRSLRVLKAASDASTSWNSRFWPGSSVSRKMKYCQLSKPRRNPTTRFENNVFFRTLPFGRPYVG